MSQRGRARRSTFPSRCCAPSRGVTTCSIVKSALTGTPLPAIDDESARAPCSPQMERAVFTMDFLSALARSRATAEARCVARVHSFRVDRHRRRGLNSESPTSSELTASRASLPRALSLALRERARAAPRSPRFRPLPPAAAPKDWSQHHHRRKTMSRRGGRHERRPASAIRGRETCGRSGGDAVTITYLSPERFGLGAAYWSGHHAGLALAPTPGSLGRPTRIASERPARGMIRRHPGGRRGQGWPRPHVATTCAST